MEIINRRQRMASIARKLRRDGKTVALVPTMGSLHEGHFALINQARQMSDVVIVSIFVNPAQFNDQTDFDRYPRDLTADAAMLADYEVDYIFAPEPQDIYGPEFKTFVYVEDFGEVLEGASRPGHFRGVATIVTILFNTVRPDFAVFGQKDAQQLTVIRRLTKDLNYDIEIIAVPTVREPSGLAMSSRNELLSNEDREKAAVIYRSLQAAENAYLNGERNASKLTQIVEDALAAEPAARVDYVSIVDPQSLAPVAKLPDSESLVATAVSFGKVRLIDNIVLKPKQ